MAITRKTSIKSKSPLSSLKKTAGRFRSVRGAGKEKFRHYISPMLATLHDEAFDDSEWIFEVKWDGYRAVAEIGPEQVKLYSRNGLSFELLYPRIVSALHSLKEDVVLDGEIVVFNERGKPDFQKLQQYGDNQSASIVYYVFDCLRYQGKNITHLPLVDRKEIARRVIGESPIIRYSEHVIGNGVQFLKEMVANDLEGMIAKRSDSRYVEGSRSRDWLKIKNHNTQEAIIAGYTQPRGSRNYFGALILAIWDKNKLRYIGHTGTGFTQNTLKNLYAQFQPLVTPTSPFHSRIPVKAGVTWVRPELVCNVKYTELTADGIMRHPVFMGLRIDKSAGETTTLDRPAKKNNNGGQTLVEAPLPEIHVTITNRKKLYWPEEGITKGDVIDYYNAIHKLILPHLKDRPQSLRRNPNGIADDGFFQKDAGSKIPPWLKTEKLRAESANRDINYIICNDASTLAYLNNLGCIELNPWHSRVSNIAKPDYLVVDIDPSDKTSFDKVIDVANAIHGILEKAGAKSYCKTSGASGLHIYVPMGGHYTYEEVKAFAELVAILTESELPDLTTTERSLEKRNGKIYLDYEQNKKGQTIASVYSVRPKRGATVSTPLEWSEVRHGLHPSQFTIRNSQKRFERKGDLFAHVLTAYTNIDKSLKNLGI